MRIMIIDDEQVIRDGLKKIIHDKTSDMQVSAEAPDGLDALALLDTNDIDICIVDIKMRHMNGIDFIRDAVKIKPNLKFIVLSGYQKFEYAQELMSLGCSAYLTKPVKHEELVRKLESLKQQIIKEQIRTVSISDSEDVTKESVLDSEASRYIKSDLDTLENGVKTACLHGDNESLRNSIRKLFAAMDDDGIRINIRKIIVSRLYIYLRNKAEREDPSNKLPNFVVFENKLNVIFSQPELEDYIISVFSEISAVANRRERKTYPYAIRKAKEYIAINYAKNISLVDIAENVGLNPSYFSQLFKLSEGITYQKYLTNFRIEKAKELIRNESLRIYEIGDEVGFPDAKYFNKVFRQTTGLTPGEYREKLL